MEDKKISAMAELLYKGAKMLPYHCPECGVPLFKKGDKIFCPACGRDAVFESEIERVTGKSNGKIMKDKVSITAKANGVNVDNINKSSHQFQAKNKVADETERDNIKLAKENLKLAILRICAEIGKEEDISSLIKMIEAIDKLISIYKNLESIF